MSTLSRVRSVGQVALSMATQMRVDSMIRDVGRSVGDWLTTRWMRAQERDRLTATRGIYHRIVWAPPRDALADGWATHTDDNQDATTDLDHDLAVESAILEARASARQDGGAWLWPVTDDDDWTEPLGDGPHDVVALHVLTQKEVASLRQEHSPLDKAWGRPRMVTVTAHRDGVSYSTKMHASRLIYVPGAPATPSQPTPHQGYDLPVLELYREALADYHAAAGKVGRLLERLSMPWVRLAHGEQAAAGNEGDLLARLQLLKESMGGPGLLAVLGDDEVGWTGPTLAGLRDGMNVLSERVSAVEGYPLTYIFGQPPGGLSTDDASGKRATHAALGHERRLLSGVLLDLYDMAMGPEKREIVWPALDTPTALEAAQMSLIYAQRDGVLIDHGTIDWTESRGRLEGPEELATPVVKESRGEGLPEMGEPDDGPDDAPTP